MTPLHPHPIAGGFGYFMGRNTYGQLGLGDDIDRNSPVYVASNVTAISNADSHSSFLAGVPLGSL